MKRKRELAFNTSVQHQGFLKVDVNTFVFYVLCFYLALKVSTNYRLPTDFQIITAFSARQFALLTANAHFLVLPHPRPYIVFGR